MENNRVSIPTRAWFGDEMLELQFPQGWEINVCRMEGHGTKPIGFDEIRAAMENPIGTPPLSQIAKGKKRVAILFDDFTRPTRAADVIPPLLDILAKAGIGPEQIRFISALGTHRPMTRNECACKLGDDVVVNYPVYNHNAYEHLVDLGKSSKGTPIFVNREYHSCDLKIGIGCVIPHVDAGFSGGLKIVLPGVMGMETINYNHMKATPRNPDGSISEFTFGKVYGNSLREDCHEIVKKVGLDFKVDVIVNEVRETVKIYAGDGFESFYEGVKFGKKFYATNPFLGADITVSNTYPIEDEAGKGLWPCYLSTREGGDVVMLSYTPDGQIHHYGNTRFGSDYGGAQFAMARKLPQSAYNRTFIVNPYHAKMDTEYFGPMDRSLVFKTWEAAVEQLKGEYGAGARVAVYPYASIQCPPFPEDL